MCARYATILCILEKNACAYMCRCACVYVCVHVDMCMHVCRCAYVCVRAWMCGTGYLWVEDMGELGDRPEGGIYELNI